jgi:aspartate-semialdehyde dehydrogenase
MHVCLHAYPPSAGGGAIIANPNCSTIIALMAVTPLHKLAKVKRMIVSTYQAASGAGAAAMEELKEQTRDVLAGKEAKPVIFPYQVRGMLELVRGVVRSIN